MHSFNDNANRFWNVSLTVSEIKRVKALAGEDLARLMSGAPSLLDRLCGDSEGCLDVIALCDILYAVCKPQADQLSVSDLEFGKALGGDAIQRGHRALMDELRLFFVGLGKRETAKAIEKRMELVEAATNLVEKNMAAIDTAELMESAQREIDATRGKSSISVPESSASTPEPSHSGNS